MQGTRQGQQAPGLTWRKPPAAPPWMDAAPSGVGAPACPVLEKNEVKEPCFPKKFLRRRGLKELSGCCSKPLLEATPYSGTQVPHCCRARLSKARVHKHTGVSSGEAPSWRWAAAHREEPGERTREV